MLYQYSLCTHAHPRAYTRTPTCIRTLIHSQNHSYYTQVNITGGLRSNIFKSELIMFVFTYYNHLT